MTDKEKQLLLIDLCGRMPHGVKVENTSFSEPQIHTLLGRVSDDEFLMLETYKSVGGEDYRRVTNEVHYTGYLESIKPYLRPLSSMTEEEFKMVCSMNALTDTELRDRINFPNMFVKSYTVETFDLFNSHHFDYRGLIPMGLALEAPKDMYKTE